MNLAVNKPRGFTIVELLIVIVVIAILASISIVAYNGIQQRARDSKRTSEISQIKKVLEFYKADTGSYPAVCAGGDNSGCNMNDLSSALVPTYISAIPLDPKNPTTYYHYVKGSGTESYAIYIQGYESRPSCKTGVNVSSGWWGSGVAIC
jgi:type II secretion system protein G